MKCSSAMYESSWCSTRSSNWMFQSLIINVEYIFMCLLVILVFFSKVSIASFAYFYYFVFSLICCRNCLYILDINLLQGICTEKIVTQFVTCLFIFLKFFYTHLKVYLGFSNRKNCAICTFYFSRMLLIEMRKEWKNHIID